MPINKDMPVEHVLGDTGLTASPKGARLDIRLPWYRAMPLSVIAIEALSIDGEAIDLDSISFELNDKSWSLAELADQTNEFWFVLDSAFLVLNATQLEPGSSHDVVFSLGVHPPYIPGMKRLNTQEETFIVN